MKYESANENGERARGNDRNALNDDRSLASRARDYLESYGSFAGKLGFVSMFPVGFVAGFGGTLLYDTGKFAFGSALYLINSFPKYSAAEIFSNAVSYVSAAPVDSLVNGLKDGVVTGLGGTIFTRWITRKILGE